MKASENPSSLRDEFKLEAPGNQARSVFKTTGVW